MKEHIRSSFICKFCSGPDVDFIAPVAEGTPQFGAAQPVDLILARVDGNRLPGPARGRPL